MAHTLIELGITPEQAAAMLSLPQSTIPEDKKDQQREPLRQRNVV